MVLSVGLSAEGVLTRRGRLAELVSFQNLQLSKFKVEFEETLAFCDFSAQVQSLSSDSPCSILNHTTLPPLHALTTTTTYPPPTHSRWPPKQLRYVQRLVGVES